MTEIREPEAGPSARALERETCLVVHPRLKSAPAGARSGESLLAEAVGLARAINLEIVHTEVVPLGRRRPSTLFGAGAVERLGKVVSRGNGGPVVTVAVVDAPLTAVQQRNLELAWQCKVIDRTGLILEIFGARARTREGRLQVELAAFSYQLSRLVRSWTHLERQRGGGGFMGGPGETQIETDRRLLGRRITGLKRQIKDVARTRHLHRQARRRVPYPVVALVGYTNAGKSTLFNRLTRAKVAAEDRLFATLDPTMRRLDLPSGRTAILSDTVGFISHLPHELINAFHATLEEVVEADVVVHVRDASHADAEAQKEDVLEVLKEIGLGDAVGDTLIEVLNKIDLLEAEEREVLANRAQRSNIPVVLLSAATGEGCTQLLAAVNDRITEGDRLVEVSLPLDDGASLAWLYEHGEVVERRDDADAVRLKARLDAANWARFRRRLQ